MKIKLLIIFSLYLIHSTAYAQEQLPYNTKPNDFVTVKNQELSDKTEAPGNLTVYDKVDLKDYNYPNCKDVPLVVNQCIKSACQQVTKIGKIYRQIKGATANAGCEYTERTPGYGGMDCIFTAEVLDKVQTKFDNFIDSFDGSLLGANDSEEFKAIINKSCKTVGDSELQNVVTIDKNAPIPSAPTTTPPQAIIEAPIAQPTPVTPPKAIPEKPAALGTPTVAAKPSEQKTTEAKPVAGVAAPRQLTKESSVTEQKNLDVSYLSKSAMFTDEELSLINQVIENLGKEDASGSPIETIKSSRSFYLKSILYYNPERWTIWINSEKITSDGVTTGLEVSNVDKSNAILKWTTPNLDKVSPEWKRKLIYVNEARFMSLDNKITVEVGAANSAVVLFTLSPNQLFEVADMKITEGPPEVTAPETKTPAAGRKAAPKANAGTDQETTNPDINNDNNIDNKTEVQNEKQKTSSKASSSPAPKASATAAGILANPDL